MLKDPHALVVPDGVKVIGKKGCKGKDYERVFIPKSVTKINDNAFKGRENLKYVVFE